MEKYNLINSFLNKCKEEKQMTGINTKSRYEVISELETKKRSLIQERDGLDDSLKEKERELKDMQRHKNDTVITLDRKIEDVNEDLDNFKNSMKEKKETIKELIKSVDDSLARFGRLAESKTK